MPEIVKYLPQHQIIEVKSLGTVTTKDIRQSFKEIKLIEKEKSVQRIFVDHSDVVVLPTDVEAFNLGSEIAIYYSNSIEEHLRFFHEVAKARGSKVKLFEEKDAALEWLKE